ncbi:hypothetical protein ACFWGN_01080 [Oerskovia sp. NPDC060338]|uniref:hypothetical protein n=1 Tax=Oerskovia sp. NPDC060338 TaxID=3347100 RepID=UPI00364CC345
MSGDGVPPQQPPWGSANGSGEPSGSPATGGRPPRPAPPWGGPSTVRPGAPYPQPPRAQRPGLRSPRAAALRSRRLRRRALLLLLPIPLLVAAIVLGVKLAFLPVIASMGSDDYDAGDYSDAADLFDVQKTMNVVDPWKAWFNTGTARHSSGDDYTAINDLHRAYDLAEGEDPMVRCQIQVNLSISYETSGDYEKITADDYMAQKKALEEALASRAAGEDYDATVIDPFGDGNELTPEQVQDDATTWYSFAERSFATAEQVRGWPGCEDRSEQEKEQNEQSVQRLQDKQQQAQDAQPQEPQDPPEGDEQEQPEPDQTEEERAEAERQEKLQEQNSEARDDEDQSQQEYQNYYGGDEPAGGTGEEQGGGGSTKNW